MQVQALIRYLEGMTQDARVVVSYSIQDESNKPVAAIHHDISGLRDAGGKVFYIYIDEGELKDAESEA